MYDLIKQLARTNGLYAIAYAILELGNGNAATNMGGLESVSKELKAVADAIEQHGFSNNGE